MATDRAHPGDDERMTAFLSRLIATALTHKDSPLTHPVVLESIRPGTIQLRLASGMLATILVKVVPDLRAGWFHQGHFHPPGDAPHTHAS